MRNDLLRAAVAWIERLQEARAYIAGMPDGIPEAMRRTIDRALEAAYYEATDKHDELEYTANDNTHWTKQDIEVLQETLRQAPIAREYNIGAVNMTMVSLRLHRTQKSVRKKAEEFGFSDRIDYWYAQKLHKITDED